jgi:hypothetical protein
MQQDREAYSNFLAGNGSATDSATSAARHKMATAVEAHISSNVVKVVEIRARGLWRNERQWAVTSTYWREGIGEQQLENSQLAFYTLCFVHWIRYSSIFIDQVGNAYSEVELCQMRSNNNMYFDLIQKFPNDIEAYHMRSNPGLSMDPNSASCVCIQLL